MLSASCCALGKLLFRINPILTRLTALLIVPLEDIPQRLVPCQEQSSTPQTHCGYVRHCKAVPALARVDGTCPLQQPSPLQHRTMVYSMLPSHWASMGFTDWCFHGCGTNSVSCRRKMEVCRTKLAGLSFLFLDAADSVLAFFFFFFVSCMVLLHNMNFMPKTFLRAFKKGCMHQREVNTHGH